MAAAGKGGRLMGLFVLVVGAILALGIIVLVLGTLFKTQWGINASRAIECPGCHQVHGQIRKPRNMRQALWGGFTCDHCGLEVDKWNRPVSS